jgi:predicted ATPase
MTTKIEFDTTTFDLRSVSFATESQFVVFTGTTISGKTEILDGLGVPYNEEVARVYIEKEVEKGRTKEDVRKNEGEFQRGLVDTKLEIERKAPKDTPQYFDRAMPDSITYYRAAGLDPYSILKECKEIQYRAVLHFDPLPDEVVERVMAKDAVRTEDLKTRLLIDEWLERDYNALGYSVKRIPVMSISDRKEFVIDVLRSLGITIERKG